SAASSTTAASAASPAISSTIELQLEQGANTSVGGGGAEAVSSGIGSPSRNTAANVATTGNISKEGTYVENKSKNTDRKSRKARKTAAKKAKLHGVVQKRGRPNPGKSNRRRKH
ncbi:unnamed protein product, partial [Strongylus vulgaris]